MGAVTVYLPLELEVKLQAYVEKTGKKRSQVVVEALREFLKDVEGGDDE